MNILDQKQRLIDVKEVAARFGMSVRCVWRYVAQGVLPAPVKIGTCTRWVNEELDDACERMKSSRAASNT